MNYKSIILARPVLHLFLYNFHIKNDKNTPQKHRNILIPRQFPKAQVTLAIKSKMITPKNQFSTSQSHNKQFQENSFVFTNTFFIELNPEGCIVMIEVS